MKFPHHKKEHIKFSKCAKFQQDWPSGTVKIRSIRKYGMRDGVSLTPYYFDDF